MGSLSQPASASNINLKSIDVEIEEGDWDAYQRFSNPCCSKNFVTRHESLIAYRQQCALAYLGKRAQFYGGVCSKMHARIFTPHFILELNAANKAQRFSRYPWLEKLVDLIAEIEREQESVFASDNVISLITATK